MASRPVSGCCFRRNNRNRVPLLEVQSVPSPQSSKKTELSNVKTKRPWARLEGSSSAYLNRRSAIKISDRQFVLQDPLPAYLPTTTGSCRYLGIRFSRNPNLGVRLCSLTKPVHSASRTQNKARRGSAGALDETLVRVRRADGQRGRVRLIITLVGVIKIILVIMIVSVHRRRERVRAEPSVNALFLNAVSGESSDATLSLSDPALRCAVCSGAIRPAQRLHAPLYKRPRRRQRRRQCSPFRTSSAGNRQRTKRPCGTGGRNAAREPAEPKRREKQHPVHISGGGRIRRRRCRRYCCGGGRGHG